MHALYNDISHKLLGKILPLKSEWNLSRGCLRAIVALPRGTTNLSRNMICISCINQSINHASLAMICVGFMPQHVPCLNMSPVTCIIGYFFIVWLPPSILIRLMVTFFGCLVTTLHTYEAYGYLFWLFGYHPPYL